MFEFIVYLNYYLTHLINTHLINLPELAFTDNNKNYYRCPMYCKTGLCDLVDFATKKIDFKTELCLGWCVVALRCECFAANHLKLGVEIRAVPDTVNESPTRIMHVLRFILHRDCIHQHVTHT
jgi:hypothetical protein